MRKIAFRAWDGTAIIKSDDWPNLMGFFGTRSPSEILMQFTGLLDKSGREIYEGDVVRGVVDGIDDYETPQEVKWDVQFAGFTPFVEYDRDCSRYYPILSCEIIGNIWENPELITKP